LLDEWRRLAADTLNAEAEAGLPKTDAARRQLGARVRVGPFWSMEHEIRALVRVVYPVRVERVAAHQRRGRPTREYSRTYGDPAQWRLSLALLSDAARLLYPYVLAAPLRKDSRW